MDVKDIYDNRRTEACTEATIAIFDILAEKKLTVAEANRVLMYIDNRIKRVALVPQVNYDELTHLDIQFPRVESDYFDEND